MPWDLILVVVNFGISLIGNYSKEKAERLAKWREWVEKRKSQAKMSADLRESYKKQKEELKKRYEIKKERLKK